MQSESFDYFNDHIGLTVRIRYSDRYMELSLDILTLLAFLLNSNVNEYLKSKAVGILQKKFRTSVSLKPFSFGGKLELIRAGSLTYK